MLKVLPQTPQNSIVEVDNDTLTPGIEFTEHNPTNVKEKDEHVALSSFLETLGLFQFYSLLQPANFIIASQKRKCGAFQ